MGYILAVLVAIPLASVPEDMVKLFDQCEYRYSGGGYENHLFRYRLFIPDNPGHTPQPMVVWLHGVSKAGNNNVDQLTILEKVLRPPWKRDRYPFFLLAIQCPSDNPCWTRDKGQNSGDDMINVAEAIVRQSLEDFPIDPSRITFSGASSGGTGCWEFSLRYPEYAAAIAPLASAGIAASEYGRLSRIAGIPVWAFHSIDDTSIPIRFVRETVRRLDDSAGIVYLTEIESGEHDCWTAAFDQYALSNWLLAQKRGSTSWRTHPKTVAMGIQLESFAKSWTWWQIMAQLSIPTIPILVLWRRWRRCAPHKGLAACESQTIA